MMVGGRYRAKFTSIGLCHHAEKSINPIHTQEFSHGYTEQCWNTGFNLRFVECFCVLTKIISAFYKFRDLRFFKDEMNVFNVL